MSGIHLLPDSEHFVYSVGTSLVLSTTRGGVPLILNGHKYPITTIATSPDGRFAATGTGVPSAGFNAELKIWNLETCTDLYTSDLHRGEFTSLCFSCDSGFLGTTSGLEDKGQVVVYDLRNPDAIVPAAGQRHLFHQPGSISFFHGSPVNFVTASDVLTFWTVDAEGKVLRSFKADINLVRTYTSVVLQLDDSMAYAGTTSGDIVAVAVKAGSARYCFHQPSGKSRAVKPFTGGIRSLALGTSGDLIAGAGVGNDGVHGALALIRSSSLLPIREVQLRGSVNSVSSGAPAGEPMELVMAGTDEGNIYKVDAARLETSLLRTSHQGAIRSVFFPEGYAGIVGTAADSTIRLWSTSTHKEMLRIHIQGIQVLCAAFTTDGRSIVSGWSDGKVRAFGPESGKLLYVIDNCHDQVTAICSSRDNRRLYTGGHDGRLRSWRIGPESQTLLHSVSEQAQQISRIRITGDDEELASSSREGTVYVYALNEKCQPDLMVQGVPPPQRCMMFKANTLFNDLVYHPDESQLVTVGADRCVSWWGAVDGTLVRELPASDRELNGVCVSPDGDHLVIVSSDSLLRVMHYEEGVVRAVGIGHGVAATAVAVAPDMSLIVTGAEDGSIAFWRYPVPAGKPLTLD